MSNNSNICGRRSGLDRNSGFSLVELMVVLAIGAVLATALAVLFSESVKSRAQVERKAGKLESGRQAIEMLRDDIRLAGFYGELRPEGTYSTPNPCETTVANLGWDPATGTVPLPVTGFEAHNETPAMPGCLESLAPDTDVLVVRRTNTNVLAAAAITPGDVYVQLRLCANAAVDPISTPFAVGTTAASLNLHTLNCDPAKLSPARKYEVHIYYISTCNDCAGAGDGIPTLKRSQLVLDGGALVMQNVPLVPYIDNMHIDYGVDTTALADGQPDVYRVASAVTAAEWPNVVATRVSLVARDAQPQPGYVDTKQFNVGAKTIPAAGDAFARQLFTEVVRVVNVSGRSETP